jgi:Lrp/AsnC family leucine-responsive transcriptional regulator
MAADDRTIDGIDVRILELLQDNARTPNVEIARQVGMAPSAVLERVRKLEERGYIRGYRTELDPNRLGRRLLAFVFVRGDEPPGSKALGSQLAEIPEVQEVHHVAGEDCYLAKVRVADPEALPTVRSTRSTIVLGTVKETGRLEIAKDGQGADGE